MSNPDRLYDKTHLSIDVAEERMLVHRDYLAHCLRWSHIIKRLYEHKNYQHARILDVGCGREMPLAKALYSNKMSGAEYCGVDINHLEVPQMVIKAAQGAKLKVYTMELTDAGTIQPEDLPWKPNIIVCLECWEHMHPRFAIRMLDNLRLLSASDCILFFSTPCWNGQAAANHVNETTYAAMEAILHDHGWYVRNHYGTFASQKDYVHQMSEHLQSAFNVLSNYYDSNLLATIFAPMFPHLSRNVLWECSWGTPPLTEFALRFVEGPWSQHEDWKCLGAGV